MKHHWLTWFACSALLAGSLMEANAQSIKMRLQSRFSYQWNEDTHGKGNCDHLGLAINGNINDEWSYAAFQHFNRFNRVTDDNPLAATDWIYLKWNKNNWELSAGKQMIEYGGEEFDASPIDVYNAGVYWNYLTAFSYAANMGYWLGNTRLTLQVAEMPLENNKKDVGFSLSWRGKLGFYEPKHSINLFGQGSDAPKLGNLVLGNVFHAGPARMYLDFINRWNGKSFKLFKDFSLVACATIRTADWMNVRVKYNYDYNKNTIDRTCPIGTHESRYLTALEFFPIKEHKDVRFHLTYHHNEASNISAGFSWKVHLMK